MSASLLSSRTNTLVSTLKNQEDASNSLVVGPFPHKVRVVRFGMLVNTALTTGAVSVTTSDDVGTISVPSGTTAGSVYVKTAKNTPSPSDGTQAQFYVLEVGDTLTVSAAQVGSSTGDYYLFVEVEHYPIDVGSDTVTAS